MKIVFFGSDDFAAAHLEALIGAEGEVLGCVTQPDRPKGRGMKVVVSPVKERAKEQHIPVWQPENLKEDSFVKELKKLHCDLFVVIAYGQFLPREIFQMPPLGAINVHASLLPKYRGAAPINWAIIQGEKETGISIIRINERMDAGDILAQFKIAINKDETSVTLRAKMIRQAPEILLKTIREIKKNMGTAQEERLATVAPKLTKELGRIQWTRPADEIDCLVRGLLPWPSAYTFYDGKILKVLEAGVIDGDSSGMEPGTVLEISKKGITVATGRGNLIMNKVHFQGSKPMGAYDFVIGHKMAAGFQFCD